ncbi:disease resistance protein At4g27190-like [Silene latifolia]|uniref:disease resistance protein At4g27190-like n=1 Tax=Silene latifolia TaxID=37657 RepID=UPI003D774753
MSDNMIRVNAQLRKVPSPDEWENATEISLMDNQFSTLPNNPNCPNLVSLFLQRNPNLRVIPSSFFDSMLNLTNLDLSKTRIRTLPKSLFKLKRLQVLVIRDCEHLMTLPSEIGLLTTLEVLDLQGTELLNLPDTVTELSKLKSLKVSFFGPRNQSKRNNLPRKLMKDGLISSFPLLEELGLFLHPDDRRWIVSASDITREVTRLMLLSAIYFRFPELENLDYFLQGSRAWKNDVVKNFNFIVGTDIKRVVPLVTRDVELLHISSERCLRFVNGETIPRGVVEVLKRANSFYLEHHIGMCYLSKFGIDNMDELRLCILSDCPKARAIIHHADDRQVILPSLEYLSLNSLWNLKSIVVGSVCEGSFGALRCLTVRTCRKLSFVFTCSMVRNLVNLEELVIMDCESLKYIVIQDDMINGYGDITAVNVGEFVVLPCLKVVKLHYLPNLVGIGINAWPNVEYMSFYNCPKLKKVDMTADDAVNVKEIAAEKAWWESVEWSEPALPERLDRVFTQIQHGDF